ncbi:polysaccharide deacetylase family protein [Nonlabens antarcticus]|uniref:polysaccharide deacetylase family protein n=1 Tax=Nonlabens antarcticus TaxID=392714 RepID=UPI0018911DCB|nr:polysaccharide deacetylase family protein [Nonlabens antarcticus]
MRLYPDHIPDWFNKFFAGYFWHGDRETKCVYLTFDDGPSPGVTPFVLEQLAIYNFKATFFLIGDCVQRNPQLTKVLKDAGHAIGNHTFNHLNSWKHSSSSYVSNVDKASNLIESRLFRPPYGRIRKTAAIKLRELGYKIVLWDVLSGDFDRTRSPASCMKSLISNTKNGSVVVFHDSEKAFPILKKVLPEYLNWLRLKGYKCERL